MLAAERAQLEQVSTRPLEPPLSGAVRRRVPFSEKLAGRRLQRLPWAPWIEATPEFAAHLRELRIRIVPGYTLTKKQREALNVCGADVNLFLGPRIRTQLQHLTWCMNLGHNLVVSCIRVFKVLNHWRRVISTRLPEGELIQLGPAAVQVGRRLHELARITQRLHFVELVHETQTSRRVGAVIGAQAIGEAFDALVRDNSRPDPAAVQSERIAAARDEVSPSLDIPPGAFSFIGPQDPLEHGGAATEVVAGQHASTFDSPCIQDAPNALCRARVAAGGRWGKGKPATAEDIGLHRGALLAVYAALAEFIIDQPHVAVLSAASAYRVRASLWGGHLVTDALLAFQPSSLPVLRARKFTRTLWSTQDERSYAAASTQGLLTYPSRCALRRS